VHSALDDLVFVHVPPASGLLNISYGLVLIVDSASPATDVSPALLIAAPVIVASCFVTTIVIVCSFVISFPSCTLIAIPAAFAARSFLIFPTV
jgi:hypothetical protein